MASAEPVGREMIAPRTAVSDEQIFESLLRDVPAAMRAEALRVMRCIANCRRGCPCEGKQVTH